MPGARCPALDARARGRSAAGDRCGQSRHCCGGRPSPARPGGIAERAVRDPPRARLGPRGAEPRRGRRSVRPPRCPHRRPGAAGIGWRLARAWWEPTMLVLIAEVEVFPVMEKMNKPVPHQLSFLRLGIGKRLRQTHSLLTDNTKIPSAAPGACFSSPGSMAVVRAVFLSTVVSPRVCVGMSNMQRSETYDKLSLEWFKTPIPASVHMPLCTCV
ncbi:uncharacterized protein GJ701_008951 isoform 2-T2 [Geothlypis trichas]